MTRSSPAEPRKRQIRTAALRGLSSSPALGVSALDESPAFGEGGGWWSLSRRMSASRSVPSSSPSMRWKLNKSLWARDRRSWERESGRGLEGFAFASGPSPMLGSTDCAMYASTNPIDFSGMQFWLPCCTNHVIVRARQNYFLFLKKKLGTGLYIE